MNNRIFDLIDKALVTNINKKPFAKKVKGEWVNFSSDLYLEKSKLIAYGLIELGFKKNDNIVILSENRPECNYVDLALLKIGVVSVPLYITITDKQLLEIVNETEAKLIFVSNKYLYLKIKDLLPKLNTIKYIYTFNNIKNENNLDDLIKIGENNNKEGEYKKTQRTISENDVCSILYTSGTTGSPKGVMLTHKNQISIINIVSNITKIKDGWRTILFLPLNHIFGKTMGYIFQITGLTTYYTEGITSLINNLQDIKPHFLASVPLELDKIINHIKTKASLYDGELKEYYDTSNNIINNFDGITNFSKLELSNYKNIDKYLFSKYRKILGGEIVTILTGGSKVSKNIFRFYSAIGINILTGYGLTETSGLITIDAIGINNEAGKNGKVIDCMKIRLDANSSEILTKGTSLMKGYYKHPKLTAKVIDKDGWFHTGDVGKIDRNGLLSIVGRIKSSFKNIAGTFVYPEPIEEELSKCLFIDNIIVTGINKYYLVALIIPNFDYIKNWCTKNKINYNKTKIVSNKLLHNEIESFINNFNIKQFGEENQVKKFELLTETWSINSGDITPTLKIKRNIILEKHKNIINKLYK